MDIVAGLRRHPAPHQLRLHVLVLHYLVLVRLLLDSNRRGVATHRNQLDYALPPRGQLCSLGRRGKMGRARAGLCFLLVTISVGSLLSAAAGQTRVYLV